MSLDIIRYLLVTAPRGIQQKWAFAILVRNSAILWTCESMAEAQTIKCCGYAVTDLQNWTYASMMKIRIHMFGAAQPLGLVVRGAPPVIWDVQVRFPRQESLPLGAVEAKFGNCYFVHECGIAEHIL
jgi:hypothetical protein